MWNQPPSAVLLLGTSVSDTTIVNSPRTEFNSIVDNEIDLTGAARPDYVWSEGTDDENNLIGVHLLDASVSTYLALPSARWATVRFNVIKGNTISAPPANPALAAVLIDDLYLRDLCDSQVNYNLVAENTMLGVGVIVYTGDANMIRENIIRNVRPGGAYEFLMPSSSAAVIVLTGTGNCIKGNKITGTGQVGQAVHGIFVSTVPGSCPTFRTVIEDNQVSSVCALDIAPDNVVSTYTFEGNAISTCSASLGNPASCVAFPDPAMCPIILPPKGWSLSTACSPDVL
jgi:hypothetical protein